MLFRASTANKFTVRRGIKCVCNNKYDVYSSFYTDPNHSFERMPYTSFATHTRQNNVGLLTSPATIFLISLLTGNREQTYFLRLLLGHPK